MTLKFSNIFTPPSFSKTILHNSLKLPTYRVLSLHFRSPVMSVSSQALPPTVHTVTIPFSDIQDKSADLSAMIEEGFGPNGLGIISISSVPGFSSLRKSLLRLSPKLAKLSEEEKKVLEDPDSRYNYGWSHGKEKLESGKPDMLKGSFYANPILDVPTTDQNLIKRYPAYCGRNIWPQKALPELEVAFKTLGRIMLDVGLMVAYHCDRYVSKGMKVGVDDGLEHIIHRSRCHKGRLLYYFPTQESDYCKNDWMSSWCGWHTDHGSLTGFSSIRTITSKKLSRGLTCGMFLKDSVQVACPDKAAGLYVKNRNDEVIKVVFGEDEIAYQIGETTEILSEGYLHATPHCVRAPRGTGVSGLERSTFALFMQPDWSEKLKFPEIVHIHKEVLAFQTRPRRELLGMG
ncbi:uncharacterized protein LOC130824563 isoform X2 [Amaranthus tricolor]|uniref:uncharacterized protein LOC130824563 isoform X2 n=1 Tax=Amaranthus tricolor TaxID=29722 RepID=UPI002589452A|nr:uncharacterized protein LOC130824563 isoform X2 [Amaranthus tricolor]